MSARRIIENLVAHAEKELDNAGIVDGDKDNYPALRGAVLGIVREFSDQGHSGGSATVALDLVDRLLRYKPLTPLTGEDGEWMNVSDMSGSSLWQNIRHSTVFKDGKRAWDIDVDHKKDITFPYTVA